MKYLIRYGSFVAALPVAMLCVHAAYATQTLDQQQLVYDGGLSARTIPGYSTWQSFTSASTGTLTEIDMGFFNSMAGNGQLRIFSGTGTSGAVLQTLMVPVVGLTQTPVTWNSWAISVPVQAGFQYTFQLIPNRSNMPDPYGVALGSNNPYAGGMLGVNDPSGSYPTTYDSVFRTFVTTVPEPNTMILASLGMLVLFRVRSKITEAIDRSARSDA